MWERDPLLGRRKGAASLFSDSRSTSSFLLPVLLAALLAKSSYVTFHSVPPLRHSAALLQPQTALLARNQQRIALLSRPNLHAARYTSLAAPPADEDALRKQMGRGWVYRSDATNQQGSSAGGPGMPLAASTSTTPEDLKHEQFGRVMREKQFRDFVVDARTGQPVDLTDEQRKKLHRDDLLREYKEQMDMEEILDPLSDAEVPSRYIYPDGESVIPKDINVAGMVPGLKDNHVQANGIVTKHTGPVFGIFREGSFGSNLTEGEFGKWGEGMGFRDRPLKVRDVDYEDLRDKKLEGLVNVTKEREARRLAIVHGNHTYYCSGKDCDDYWGHIGAGDQVVDLRTGEVMDGYSAVGPKGQQMRMEGWKLDRNIDPHTGVEMPDCVGPQCKEFTISFGDGKSPIEDSYGAPPTGHAVFGAAIPGNADESPEKVRNYWREREFNPRVEGGVVEAEPGEAPDDEGEADSRNDGVEPYALDPSQRFRYGSKYDHGYKSEDEWMAGGWAKDWDWGSWLGFVIIGPILTAGVSVFVFMTRGPPLGLAVLGGMVVLDIVMYYFG